jgi:hypothetical protein
VNEIFNLRRLWLLLRGDLIADWRVDAIVCGTLTAVLLIVSMFTVFQGGETENFYLSWYFGGLFIWGPIAASFSFRELHDKARNEAYLLLPASSLEKVVARLLQATIVFLPFLVIFMTVASALVESITWLVFGRRNGFFDASHEAVWAPVGHFLIVVSLYFLGAAWFRKLHFLKTALTLTALPIALGCFAAAVAWMVFEGTGTSGFHRGGPEVYNFYVAHRGLFDALLGALKVLYFVGLPLFCWCVAWLRVKETEVSHGV